MKVVHSFKTYFPESCGGVEQVIRQICLETAKHGITNTVLTTTIGKDDHILHDGVNVMRFHRTLDFASSPLSISMLNRFSRIIDTADVIHYHFPWPQNDLMYLLRGRQKNSVLTYHSDIVKQRLLKFFYRPVMKRFLSIVDSIVVTSPNYLETSEDLYPYRDKVRIIPIGIDEYAFKSGHTERYEYWKRKYEQPFALFVGVLRYYKGLHYLLRAIKGATYKVVIAGAGPLAAELQEEAKKLDLNNVHFIGHVEEEDKHALYELCRCVIFPSHLRSEAFGVTLLEGAMHAKPLVSTEIGTGTSYINLHDKTGFVVEPGNPVALRRAIDLLMSDEHLARKMGDAAKSRYLQLFTADRMASAYAQLYSELLVS